MPEQRSAPTISRILILGPVVAFAVFLCADFLSDYWKKQEIAATITDGVAARAAPVFRKYGCSGCHTIPGVPGADGKVGGELSRLSERVYIAGVLTNTPANLIDWIVAPEKYTPRTAMPNTGITQAEARDVAAYLYQN